ncbi:heat shock protein 9/12-domain-containing protein [Lipomyces tetrasporus]|uniref:Heat shock protein 9/12-domain-containing protein n=1 Tax=Lipomyces tetrasporus TaxID=54092 RepID=A0AAD7VT13_9ASCO|nr:heat shock protein 9/12-domain-containing protein [Lipomyces tetrasporus]KAJ8100928.1 heat shock protein 9/12-domain-containing protein [Lipomyces tetrasporus]
MSDAGRKNVSDKVSETVTPDSQKSYAEQMKEQVTGTYDRAARHLQPEESKSSSQSATDTVTGKSSETKDTSQGYEHSFVDAAKQYATTAQQSATEALHSASEYLSGKGETRPGERKPTGGSQSARPTESTGEPK